eukprot:m.200527 g.200527  ORF g.200527 m.200527 type:complete len:438 (+) comp13711_c0_seq1:142-1455(+)
MLSFTVRRSGRLLWKHNNNIKWLSQKHSVEVWPSLPLPSTARFLTTTRLAWNGFNDNTRGNMDSTAEISDSKSNSTSSSSSTSTTTNTIDLEGSSEPVSTKEENSCLLPPSSRRLFDRVVEALPEIYEDALLETGGNVAHYIPELKRVDPHKFGISVCSTVGETFSLGDSEDHFTIQSCVKPMLYNLAMNLAGDVVHNHIGHEPSGAAFNAFILTESGKPHNPMINAGAIMSSALVVKHSKADDSFIELRDFIENAIKGISSTRFDPSIYNSEQKTASRNRSLTYFMQERDTLLKELQIADVLRLYFQACSLTIDTKGLAALGAMYASGGLAPFTGEELFSASDARKTLSLMFMCGMYDYSGRFGYEMGIPAKSGISGAVYMSIPGEFGIGIWSPPVCEHGNSLRAIHVMKALVNKFPEIHTFGMYRTRERCLRLHV